MHAREQCAVAVSLNMGRGGANNASALGGLETRPSNNFDHQDPTQHPTKRRRKQQDVQGANATKLRAKQEQLLEERRQLPVWSAKQRLLELVGLNQTLVIVGETGSGKSTQIPQFLLQSGYAQGGMVACTQPRRVAATTVARRVAEEMGVRLGQEVGYSVRFDDTSSAATRIKYMTDGMLLREALLDPLLSKYKVVLVDEAHERTVHTDVLLGVLKDVQRRRRSAVAAAAVANYGSACGGALAGCTLSPSQDGHASAAANGSRAAVSGAANGGRSKPAGTPDATSIAAATDSAAAGGAGSVLSAAEAAVAETAVPPALPPAAAAGAGRCSRDLGLLRIIIMSATLDAESFVHYFEGAVAAYVQGRQYPVDVLYTSEPQDSYTDAAMNATLQIHAEEPAGDILVFLTGQDEIDSLQRLLEERAEQMAPGPSGLKLMVTPIYAALPPEQQMQVFEPAPEGYRKAILATNIAEASITIRGVRFVVDTGMVKSRQHDARRGADLLQVLPISQSQARQRSGRAGREAPGRCYRLYTEATFHQLAPAVVPEIMRSGLASVVLQLKALGIDDVLGFDFMDAPPKIAIIRSLELLLGLGALDSHGHLTDAVGRPLAKLPVDPMYGKVLLASAALGCSIEATMVVAMASAESPFTVPRNKREESQGVHRRFAHNDGDHPTLLGVLRAFLAMPRVEQAQWCSDNFLNIRSLRKAHDICAQLFRHLDQLSIPRRSCGADLTPLRRALAAGLFPHAAHRQPDNSYRVVAGGQVVTIHPASVLSGKRPEWIVFDELVETTRKYARNVCVIEAGWLPALAPTYFQRAIAPSPPATAGAAATQ